LTTLPGASISAYNDTSAVPGTLYAYTVKSYTAAGDGPSSASDTGWRMLATPASIVATDGTRLTDVQVTWTAVAGATQYKILRNGAQVGTSAAPSYLDATAVPGTVYEYRVKASGSGGDGSESNANTGYRGLAPPTSVMASDGTSASNVTVTWTAVTGATGYKVFRSGTVLPIGTPTTNSFSDTSAILGTKYTYTVRATAAGVNDSAVSAGDTGWRSLLAPTGVAATNDDTSKIRVTWSAVTGARGYFVYRGPAGGVLSRLQPTAVTGTTFDDLSAVPGIVYDYAVSAYSALGECVRSEADPGLRPATLTGDGPMSGGMPSGGRDLGPPNGDDGSGNRMDVPPDLAGVELYFWMVTQAPDVDVGCTAPQPSQVHLGPAGDTAALTEDIADGLIVIDARMKTIDVSVSGMSGADSDAIDIDSNGEPDICQLRRGDLNLDGAVDASDVSHLLLMIGSKPLFGIGDLDGDDTIGPADVQQLLRQSAGA
jgi:hypothetical protein